MSTFIRSSKHSLKFANKGKLNLIQTLIEEYEKVVEYYIDFLWNNEIIWHNRTLNIKEDKLDCPKMISVKNYPQETLLYKRAIKCAADQACAMVKACLVKRRKLLWKIKQEENKGRGCSQ